MSTVDALQAMLDRYSRLPLAGYPTPLEYLPRLSKSAGIQLYLKRDDQIGPGMGGNKTRKLEYLLAEAQELGERRVVTFGGLQSNHARITAAAARACGMEPHLFYFAPRPRQFTGNLLINEILDAHMHFVPLGNGGSGMTLEATIRLVRLLARLWVGRHYFIPVGGHSWRGCLGYVRAALEIHEQASALGIQDARLVVAAGTGGTLAGLMAGLALIRSPLRLVGIDVGKLWKAFPASIARLAGELCTHLGSPRAFSADQVAVVERVYVGPGYGLPSEACLSAIRRLAQLEGIVLDPVYTGKAFAGLLDLVKRGEVPAGEPVIFLHTGGLPALFACSAAFATAGTRGLG